MTRLNYLSTLKEVQAASDDVLRQDIGSLSPELVTDYVFHLRNSLQSSNQILEENNHLKREIQSLKAQLSKANHSPHQGNSVQCLDISFKLYI